MTEISSDDLDRQMGRQIDPNSVPTHIGGDHGAMEGVIERGSDMRIQEQGAGRYGVPVFNEHEVGGNDYYGSQTIISINEAPPLNPVMEPKPQAPKPVVKPILPVGMPPALAAVMGTVKPAAPAPVAAQPPQQPTKPVVPVLAGKPGAVTPGAAALAANLNVLASLGVTKKP